MLYKHAILLYRMYNSEVHSNEWVHLNLNQVITSRQTKFNILKPNQFKVGLNAPANRLHSINNLIPFTWLNCSIDTFKVRAKDLILKWNLKWLLINAIGRLKIKGNVPGFESRIMQSNCGELCLSVAKKSTMKWINKNCKSNKFWQRH